MSLVMLQTLGLAFLAGILSILSPCVLPLLPIVFGTAAAQTRLGPVALAAGLSVSFVAIGLFVATIGFALGLDGDLFRTVGAIMLVIIGLVLALPRLQASFATATGPLSNWTERNFGGASGSGSLGQFGIGLMLGAVWTPCVGPTLGAASVLAAQGRDLAVVATTMLVFGIGAGLPLLAVGALSRQTLRRWREPMLRAGRTLKAALGGILLLTGVLILTGFDRILEDRLTEASPAWLTDLTSRF